MVKSKGDIGGLVHLPATTCVGETVVRRPLCHSKAGNCLALTFPIIFDGYQITG